MLIPCSEGEFLAQIVHLFIFSNSNPFRNSNPTAFPSDLENKSFSHFETEDRVTFLPKASFSDYKHMKQNRDMTGSAWPITFTCANSVINNRLECFGFISFAFSNEMRPTAQRKKQHLLTAAYIVCRRFSQNNQTWHKMKFR